MALNQKNTIDWHLSASDTRVLKGVAICCMLCWHLFYCPNQFGEEFSELTKWFGLMGDVCVSVFLFVSGYGLTIQFGNKNHSNDASGLKFVILRIIKFYSSFWIVLLIVLPIGILVLNRPLIESDSTAEVLQAWFREIFAISGHSSYNSTWWFNTLIIEMYLIFPVLYYGLKYACIPTLLFAFMQRHLSIAHIGLDMQIYIPIFVIGMLFAMYANNITKWCHRFPAWTIYVIAFIGLVAPAIALPLLDRIDYGDPIFYKGIKLYGVLTIAIMMLIVLMRGHCVYSGKCFAFLGKHSSNIYWMHKFFYFYWFPTFFYSLHNPILIFIALMSVCLLLSILLEWIKDVSSYNRFVNGILTKIS